MSVDLVPAAKPLRLLHGLSEIASDFDAIFCDVWGVVHNGRSRYEPACGALIEFRKAHGPVILVTNAPVRKEQVQSYLASVGVPEECWDDIASSGEATRRLLSRHGVGPVYRIGTDGEGALYEGLELSFTEDPAKAAIVSCTSLRSFPYGEPQDHIAELEALQAAGAPMICANPDVRFRYGSDLVWAAGALAEIYERLGGRVIMPGKPNTPIYELARAMLPQADTDHRILAIGDGPDTDLKGATEQSLPSLFIGDGVHGAQLSNDENFLAAVEALLTEKDVHADYVMHALSW